MATNNTGPGDSNLSGAAALALARVMAEANRRMDLMNRNLARFTQTLGRGGAGRGGGGGGGGSGGSSSPGGRASPDGAAFAAAISANTNKIGALVAAVERNTAAMRGLAGLTGVSAAAGVARVVQSSGRTTTPSPRLATPSVPRSAVQAVRMTPAVQAQASRSVPASSAPVAAADTGPVKAVRDRKAAESDPEQNAINRAKRRAARLAELKEQGLSEDEVGQAMAKYDADSAKRQRKKKPAPTSQPGSPTAAESAWNDLWDTLGSSKLPQGAGPPRPLTPLEMTPGEAAARRGGKGGGAGGRGGNGPDLSITELVRALDANTRATDGNTAAMRAVRQAVRGPRGGGGPGGDYGDLTSVQRRRNWVGRTDDFRQDLGRLSGASAGMAAAGAGGILGMVSAISPSAISTLSDSFAILSGEIGKSFVPAIYSVAHGLQDATRYVAGLDDGLKAGAARIAIFSVGGLATLSIGSRVLSGTLGVLTTTVKGFGAAMTFAFTTPLGLAITGVAALTAGVVTATGQWNNLASAAGRALGYIGEKAADGVRAIGELGQQQRVGDLVNQLPEAARRQILAPNLKPEQTNKTIAHLIAQNEEALEKAREGLLPEQAPQFAAAREREAIVTQAIREVILPDRRMMEGVWQTAGPEQRAVIDREQGVRDIFQHFRGIARAEDIAKQRGVNITRSEITQGMPQGGPLNEPYPATSRRILPRDGSGPASAAVQELIRTGDVLRSLSAAVVGAGGDPSRYLHNVKSPISARYTDAMSFRDSVQLAALNTGDLEADKVQRQLEEMDKHEGVRTQQLLDALAEANATLRELADLPWVRARR